jgi:hypothetical protein
VREKRGRRGSGGENERRQMGPVWQTEKREENARALGRLRRNGPGRGKERREERKPKGEKRVGRRGPCGKREGKGRLGWAKAAGLGCLLLFFSPFLFFFYTPLIQTI